MLTDLPARDFVILGYTGMVATGGAYLAFLLGMQASPSATAGIASTLIEPGVAALLAALILDERLNVAQGLGCLLMVAAVAILAFAGLHARRRDTRSAGRARHEVLSGTFPNSWRFFRTRPGGPPTSQTEPDRPTERRRRSGCRRFLQGIGMNSIIYLVGLVVIVMAILSFVGIH